MTQKVKTPKRYSGSQHCTSRKCPFMHSHTGNWCGYPQKRKCKCGFCHPKGL